MKGALLAIRQWLCSHEKRLDDLRRVGPDLVECPCVKCGKVLRAEYGIALLGRWK
jgi:hypothetical protein